MFKFVSGCIFGLVLASITVSATPTKPGVPSNPLRPVFGHCPTQPATPTK
jgi:hypothetical protein